MAFLFDKIGELAPKSDAKAKTTEANVKKREREDQEEPEASTKKVKLAEAVEQPIRSATPSSQEDKTEQDGSKSESRPLTAAERLAKVKAQRAEKGPIGGMTRELTLEKFDSRRDKGAKLTTMTSYSTSNDDEGSDDGNDGRTSKQGNRRGDARSYEVSVNPRNGKRDNQRGDNQRGDRRGDRDQGRGDRRRGGDYDDENGGDDKQNNKPDRCAFYPNCTKGEECPFFHPTQPCRNYPNCSKGDHCDYVHPPCKFGDNCARRPMCPYAHSLASEGRSAYPMGMMNMMNMGMGMHMMGGPPCKNGFACPKKPNCSFQHPAVICRYGSTCRNGHMCMFSHAAPCRNGAECTLSHCKFGHPAPGPKVDANAVSNISDTLPLTPKEDASPIVEEVEETA